MLKAVVADDNNGTMVQSAMSMSMSFVLQLMLLLLFETMTTNLTLHFVNLQISITIK